MGAWPKSKEVTVPNPRDKNNTGVPPAPNSEILLDSHGEVVVKHEDLPAKPPADKKIHPRRPLPLVPDKSEEGSKDNE
jgi:hypothetical protein